MFRIPKSWLCGLWLATLAIICLPDRGFARDADWARVSARAMPSVVRLEDHAHGRRGSGFVVDADGYILTNAHVVRDTEVVSVRFEDGRQFRARVVQSDGWVDLALLRIEGGARFPALTFSAPESVRRGDPVAALGSPFDYLFSLSRGVVSGFDRTYTEQDAVGFLQHDAAINPGSSGGPLVDRRGRVVAVNAATPPEARTDIGISLGIPADIAQRFIERAHNGREQDHGVLGVRTRQLTPELASVLGRPATDGLLVEHVTPASAAATAGLQVGDVIRSLDSTPLATPRRLGAQLWNRAPGDRVELEIDRVGGRLRLHAVLDEPSTEARSGPFAGAGNLRADRSRSRGFGLTLQWRTQDGESGLEVAAVAPRSPASAAGLGQGDRILMLNGESAETLAQANALLDAAADTLVALVSRPSAEQQYIVLSRSTTQTMRAGAVF